MLGNHLSLTAVVLLMPAGLLFAQASTSTHYVPGVTYQSANPNYPQPNPFYFEGRIDWNLLNITTPGNAWEYAQRGIHKQDDLGDTAGAMQDYEQSIAMNSLANGTCQLVTGTITTGVLNPPPCMFTVRLRLAGLLRQSAPENAIALYREVLTIDPLKLSVHAAIAEVYTEMAAEEKLPANATADYNQAVTEYQAELALSPVTPATTALTGDQANNAHVHWDLAEIYRTIGNTAQEASELDLYLKATQWHSDTYPWRITLAKARLAAMNSASALKTKHPEKPRSVPPEKR